MEQAKIISRNKTNYIMANKGKVSKDCHWALLFRFNGDVVNSIILDETSMKGSKNI